MEDLHFKFEQLSIQERMIKKISDIKEIVKMYKDKQK